MNLTPQPDLPTSPSRTQVVFRSNRILLTPSQPTYMTSPFYDRAATANDGIRLHSRTGDRGIRALPFHSPTGKLCTGSTNKAKNSMQALLEERSSNFYDLTSQKAFPARFFNINPEGKQIKQKALTNLNHCLDSRRLGTSQKRLNINTNRYSLGMTDKIDQTPIRTPMNEKADSIKFAQYPSSQAKVSARSSTKESSRKIQSTSLEFDAVILPPQFQTRDQVTPLGFAPPSYHSLYSGGATGKSSSKASTDFKGSFLIRNLPILSKPVSKTSKARNQPV